MKRLLQHLLVAALLVGAAASASAHDDAVLNLGADGSLQGLPANYAPARLALRFGSVDDERRLMALRLQLGQASVQVPTCILGLLHASSAEQLQLRASWTHDESVVPYYLAARFAEPDDAGLTYTLLFNLHTARLMEVSLEIAGSGRIERSLPLDLHARCGDDELAGVLAR